MKIATAFSGGFGSIEFAMKYENIEHEVVFACEWMKPQRESYILNHGEPTSNFYEDIRDMDGNKYKDEIDLYHLSPPCQSYSMAGSRGGALDERGGLMFEAIKSIDDVQPKIFTVENVKGLLSSNNAQDWRNILKDFHSLPGYTISWGVMNAKHQGTPQNRERVFLVGVRADLPQMPFPKKIPLNKCLADILEDEVDEKYYLSDKAIKGLTQGKSIFSERFKIKDLSKTFYANCIDTRSPLSRRTSTFFKRNNKNSFMTTRECARCQGDFEDRFKFGSASDTKLYEFIGNAMDISTTRRLIRQILDYTKDAVWNEVSEPTFTRKETQNKTLFDL